MLRKNLSTEHTEGTDGWELDGIILGSLRLEILEEILFKMLLRKKSLEEICIKEWPGARNLFNPL